MISFSTLTKLATGGLGPDELTALLTGIGMEVSMLPVRDASADFAELAKSAIVPGSRMLTIRGRLKDGETLHALLIVGQE